MSLLTIRRDPQNCMFCSMFVIQLCICSCCITLILINYVITLLDYIVIICIVFVEWLLTVTVRINSVAFEKVKVFAMTLVSTFIDRLVIVICL